jgi:hypothetical protein
VRAPSERHRPALSLARSLADRHKISRGLANGMCIPWCRHHALLCQLTPRVATPFRDFTY